MKVKIILNQPLANIPDDITQISIQRLDDIQSSTCTELDIGDCLDYILERDRCFMELASKLRYNGIFKISGIDIVETSRLLISGKLRYTDAINLLYGGKLSTATLEHMCELCQMAKLSITYKNLGEYQYTIIATRKIDGITSN